MTFDLNELENRMKSTLSVFEQEMANLRTGRASPLLLNSVMVDAYGSMTPLVQVASVSAPEARMLVVSVWDKGLVKNVEKAIRESQLGFNPMVDGNTLRVPVPPLSEERRIEMKKIAGGQAETARVAIRNIRRDGMTDLKKQESDIGSDAVQSLSQKVQQLTDKYVEQIGDLLSRKEQEIMQV